MHTLFRGGRAAANPVASRPTGSQTLQGFCNGKVALMLQHQAQRQALLVVAAARKRYNYQDFEQDSLDLDSMDELDEKFNKFADIKASGQKNGAAPSTNVYAQQQTQTPQGSPPPATRAPASFDLDSFGTDYGFDDNWGTTPLPPSGGNSGGYGKGGGYVDSPSNGGGYRNGNGNGSGYSSDSGYTTKGGGYSNGGGGYGNGGGYVSGGAGSGGGYADIWTDFNAGGFGSGYGGGYGSGGYVGGGSYGSRQRSGSRYRQMTSDFEDEYIDEPVEVPVVKVDSCVINGKTILCNHGIKVKEVFLLGSGAERSPLGTVPLAKAQALADESKEDLLLLNPDAYPPVARIIKWDKYKYEQERATKERKAKSTTTETKEVRMRPSTDSGDIQTKLKSCKKFLSKGDRVKLVMKFEGREVQFKEQGKEVLLNFITELSSVAKVEGPLNFKTGTYTILLSPKTA